MKVYKYKVEQKNCSSQFKRNTKEESDYLDKNGSNGWELVAVVPYDPSTNIDKTTYYWKTVDESK